VAKLSMLVHLEKRLIMQLAEFGHCFDLYITDVKWNIMFHKSTATEGMGAAGAIAVVDWTSVKTRSRAKQSPK